MVSHVRDGTNHLNDFRKAWFPTTIISTSVKKVRIWVLNRVIFFGLTTFKLFSYVLRMRLLKCYLSAHTFQNLNSSSPALLLKCKCKNVQHNLEKRPFFDSIRGSLRYLPKLIGVRKTKRLLFDIATMLRLILFCCGPTCLRLVRKKKKTWNSKEKAHENEVISFIFQNDALVMCPLQLSIFRCNLRNYIKLNWPSYWTTTTRRWSCRKMKAPFAPAKKCKKKKYTIVQ